MKKLSLEKFAGKCAIPNNPELEQYEMLANMTPSQRFHAGFPIEFPYRREPRTSQYEREARRGRQTAYKKLLKNY